MLEIRGLEAGYNGKAVVRLAQFTLPRGEHCLVLGASGSGKTTLLYTIANLLAPVRGDIVLEGENMAARRGRDADSFRARHIGIVHQTLHMVNAVSVLQNLLLTQYAAGIRQDAAAALRWLERLGLSAQKDEKPVSLSQGQRQRLSIARAAINAPSLILGDELTSALDDAACENVMRVLLEVAAASRASLMVATHDRRIERHFQHRLLLEGGA